MTHYCAACDRPYESKAAAEQCARVDAELDAEARRSK